MDINNNNNNNNYNYEIVGKNDMVVDGNEGENEMVVNEEENNPLAINNDDEEDYQEDQIEFDNNMTSGSTNNNNNNNNNNSKKKINKSFLYIAAYTANLAAFSCGITLGWTSPVLPKLKTINKDNPLSVPITPNQEGWIGSLLPFGAAIGPFLACLSADKIGRKKTLFYGSMPFIIGLLLNIIASNVNLLFLSRFLIGISVGVTFTVLPMYIGEIAEAETRDTLGTLLQLFVVVGLMFSFVLGPYMPYVMYNVACLFVPSVFLIAFYMFIPESPHYLLQANKVAKGEKALMKFRGKKQPHEITDELNIIKKTTDEAAATKCTFIDIFKSKGLTKAYVLSNGLLIFQQFTGINIILFYSQNIFQDAGVSLAPEICTIIIGIVQVISCVASSLLIKKHGKRFLLMLSAIGMAIAEMSLAYFFYLKDNKQSDMSSLSWLPILCLILFIITFCLGFGPVPWAVMAEMFPSNIKSVASTCGAATSWLLAFLLTKYFVIVQEIIGKSGSFGLFGLCCVGAFGFIYFFLPETSGKSLQEIQDILNGIDSNKNDEKMENS